MTLAVVLYFAQLIPGRDYHPSSAPISFREATAVYCLSANCFLKLLENYGICPTLISKAKVRRIFKAVVKQRQVEGDLWPHYRSPRGNTPKSDTRLPLSRSTSSTIHRLQHTKSNISATLSSTFIYNVNNNGKSGNPPTTSPKNATTTSPHSQFPQTLGSGGASPRAFFPLPPFPPTASENDFPDDLATFCEFQQMLVEVALEGLDQPNYTSLFPTSFSKVAALLVDWSIADMEKLANIRRMRATKTDFLHHG